MGDWRRERKRRKLMGENREAERRKWGIKRGRGQEGRKSQEFQVATGS